MRKTKLTVRIEVELLKRARPYADMHGTTVTRLVNEFFRSLDRRLDEGSETPVLDELSGTLSSDVSVNNDHNRMERKHLRDGESAASFDHNG